MSIGLYLWRICLIAVTGGIVILFYPEENEMGKAIRFIVSIVVISTVLSPLSKLGAFSWDRWTQGLDDSALYCQQGKEYYTRNVCAIINERTRAYILDKAQALDAKIVAEVVVDEENLRPTTVIITGRISPYAREKLAQIMQADLGLKPEAITWKT